MPIYICKWHIVYDGKLYSPGDKIELPTSSAQKIGHALVPYFHKDDPAAEASVTSTSPIEAKEKKRAK